MDYTAVTVIKKRGKRRKDDMEAVAGGAFMSVKYKNGDSIKVNNNFMERGYLLAYSPSKNVYGYVDAKYVRF